MLDAIEADILNLETTLEAAPAADVDFATFAAAPDADETLEAQPAVDGFAAFETAPATDADEGLISFDATPEDEGFASFEAAPVATTPVEPTPAPRETAQKTSPFEAAIAARRARSEAQTDAQRPDPLAGARVSVQ